MEISRQLFRGEWGAVPIWVAATGAVFAIYQIYRLMKGRNREINNTREKNGPMDTINPPVIDGDIIVPPSHKAVEGQGGNDVTF